MVAPLVEALLHRFLRRRASAESIPVPGRLASAPHVVDALGFVADGTTVLLTRPGAEAEVLEPGRVVVPALLGPAATYVVLTHEPVDVWLRVGPFDTADGRVVEQVELRLRVAVAPGSAALADVARHAEGDDLAEALLLRLAREVTTRTADAFGRRTLSDLAGLSVQVLLDGTLPDALLSGLLVRSELTVEDVDWPTESRGWPVLPSWGTGAAPVPR